MIQLLIFVLLFGSIQSIGCRKSSQHVDKASTADTVAQQRDLSRRVFVLRVIDGDTVDAQEEGIRKKFRIRLAGIDAPEKSQDFSRRSTQQLRRLVLKKSVLIIGSKTDRNGRLVAKLVVGKTDANLALIESGLAWHYKKYANEQSMADRRAYANAEKRARAMKIGIWSHENPIPPWDFRAGISHDPSIKGKIIGNRRSRIYHWEGCPGFTKTYARNRRIFRTTRNAIKSGFRPAKNCKTPEP